MNRSRRARGSTGFTLLPVVLAMSLVAAVAFLLNRDNGINTNLIGARSDREHARYAAEAGLQAANYAIQANACGGGYPISSSPVIDNDFGGATYSAYASSVSGSPLTLTSIATYKGSSVTLTRNNVYAYQSGIRTWTTPISKVTDTYVEGDNPTLNYGASAWLLLDKDDRDAVLLRFDLSAFPAGSRIVPSYDLILFLQPGAVVKLYEPLLTGSTKAFLAMLITRSWVAGTKTGSGVADGATWRTYDGISTWPSEGVGYDSRELISVPDPLLGGLLGGTFSFDVTAAALRWMTVPNSNFGIWLHPNGTAQNYKFASTSDASNYPKLILSYLLPCGASAPA